VIVRRIFVATSQGLAIVFKEEEVMPRGVVVELTEERVEALIQEVFDGLSYGETREELVTSVLERADEMAQHDIDEDAARFEDDQFDEADGESPF
jgi:hypothetical protein